MCGIAGCYILGNTSNFWRNESAKKQFNDYFFDVLLATSERGIDSFGLTWFYKDGSKQLHTSYKTGEPGFGGIRTANSTIEKALAVRSHATTFCALANFSAEQVPIRDNFTIQPFLIDSIGIVHNGVISNDAEILNAYPELLDTLRKEGYSYEKHGKLIDSWAILSMFLRYKFSINYTFSHIEGSYAFALMLQNGELVLARNYRALSVKKVNIEGYDILFFASKAEYLNTGNMWEPALDFPPYSCMMVTPTIFTEATVSSFQSFRYIDDGEVGLNNKAVVVFSGGLDSTTVATLLCEDPEITDITLLYFTYGCLAENKELKAVHDIKDFLSIRYPKKNISLEVADLSWISKIGGSTLTDPEQHRNIAVGDAGVETHSEWVPARNLVMMSLAAAYCDRHRIGYMALGLNEAGAFPDNTTEFHECLERAMCVGTTSRPRIINPLGTRTKHDIYRMARTMKAPIHLSWSCYRNGDIHCGTCGPCTMRKESARMNNMEDNIEYVE